MVYNLRWRCVSRMLRSSREGVDKGSLSAIFEGLRMSDASEDCGIRHLRRFTSIPLPILFWTLMVL